MALKKGIMFQGRAERRELHGRGLVKKLGRGEGK